MNKRCSQYTTGGRKQLCFLWMASLYICYPPSVLSTDNITSVCSRADYLKKFAGSQLNECKKQLTDFKSSFSECCDLSLMNTSQKNSSTSPGCQNVAIIKSIVRELQDDPSAQDYIALRLSEKAREHGCRGFFKMFCTGRSYLKRMDICIHYSAWEVATSSVIKCPPPPLSKDSRLYYRLSGALNQYATFHCDHRYKIDSDNSTFHCNITSRTWAPLPHCKKMQVQKLSCAPPEQDMLTYQMNKDFKRLHNFSCPTGYTLDRNKSRVDVATCDERTNTWSYVPKCNLVPTKGSRVPHEQARQSPVLHCQLPVDGNLTYQLSANLTELSHFTCPNGFKVSHPTVVAKCDSTTKKWKSLPKCNPIQPTTHAVSRTSQAGTRTPEAKLVLTSPAAPAQTSSGNETSDESSNNDTSSADLPSDRPGSPHNEDGKDIPMTNTQGVLLLLLLLAIVVILYLVYTHREALRDKILSQDTSSKPVYQKLPTTVKDSLEAGLSRLKHNTHED